MVSEDALVTISEASRILGVSEPALRQWTDEGKIKAFITPGGHRRYLRAELKRFVTSHQKMLGIKDLAARIEDTVPAHRALDTTFLHASWHGRISEELRSYLASEGRELLRLIIRAIREPSRQEEVIQSVREIGSGLGAALARLDLPLTVAVQTFLQHREPIARVTTYLMQKRQALNRRVVEAIPLVDHVMDEALIALVTAHQQYRSSVKPTTQVEPDDINITPAL